MLFLNKDETCFYMKHVMYGFLRNYMQRERTLLNTNVLEIIRLTLKLQQVSNLKRRYFIPRFVA